MAASERINDYPPPSWSQGTCCMSSQCLGTRWCGDDVLGRASSQQSQGHRGDGKLNAPTVACLQKNTWMSESHSEEKGSRDQRGPMTVPHLTSDLFDISAA